MNKRLTGGFIEQKVFLWLQQSQGYRLIEKNYRCPRGEIDLVANDHAFLVFVEVRSRQGRRFGTPEESITRSKQNRVSLVAQYYLAEHQSKYKGIRFDVVAVDVGTEGEIKDIRLYKDAFRPR